MSDMPREVQEAYEKAAGKQPPHYEPLPPWETLSRELREAFIFVYYQGRTDGIKEIRDLPADWRSATPTRAC
jgi:hypothetical protein